MSIYKLIIMLSLWLPVCDITAFLVNMNIVVFGCARTNHLCGHS